MSEEEKKAIEELTEIKELIEEDLKYKDYEVTATLDQIDLESLVIVLNLIEKQQKEIEELKEDNKQKYYHVVKNRELEEEINNVWGNKIKAEIEEQKNMRVDGVVFRTSVNYAIKVLQSLLEKE